MFVNLLAMQLRFQILTKVKLAWQPDLLSVHRFSLWRALKPFRETFSKDGQSERCLLSQPIRRCWAHLVTLWLMALIYLEARATRTAT